MASKIMIVDDSAFMRRMLRDILVKGGFEIAEAENGLQAVEKYKELRPDLVTMDIIMPDIDGIEAVKSIIEADPQARIVMCSAMGQEQLTSRAIQTGAKDFIIKPFQPSKVLEVVKAVIEKG
jgi:two-component system chemotaxis response regulator CheY